MRERERERHTHTHTHTHTELNMEGVCLVCVEGSRLGAVTAKYGEKSVYFDLGDISNTTGKWDLYGNDEPNRYNGLQVDRHLVCSPPLAVLKDCCRDFSAIS
jgi:hypothetical protein